MKIQQIHHVAYRCKDAKQTVDFYKQVLSMDLLGAIAEDRVPCDQGARSLHAYLSRCGRRQYSRLLQSFPTHPRWGKTRIRPSGPST